MKAVAGILSFSHRICLRRFSTLRPDQGLNTVVRRDSGESHGGGRVELPASFATSTLRRSLRICCAKPS